MPTDDDRRPLQNDTSYFLSDCGHSIQWAVINKRSFRTVTEYRFILADMDRKAVLSIDLGMPHARFFHRLNMSRRRVPYPPIRVSDDVFMNLGDLTRSQLTHNQHT